MASDVPLTAMVPLCRVQGVPGPLHSRKCRKPYVSLQGHLPGSWVPANAAPSAGGCCAQLPAVERSVQEMMRTEKRKSAAFWRRQARDDVAPQRRGNQVCEHACRTRLLCAAASPLYGLQWRPDGGQVPKTDLHESGQRRAQGPQAAVVQLPLGAAAAAASHQALGGFPGAVDRIWAPGYSK